MRLLVLFTVAALGSAGCGGGSSVGPAGTSGGASVLGEKLTTRVIQDPKQGMPAGVVAVPATWNYDSRITWNYAWVSNPVNSTMKAENPANQEAVIGFGGLSYFDLRPAGYYRIGQNYGGQIFGHPTAPVQTLARFVQQQRGREPMFTVVGSKELPDLPKALQISDARNQQGVGLKVTYTMNGKPVEEEFYAVGYRNEVPYDGPQGRTWQINWGLLSVHSFRAPAGTLDKRRPVFAAVAKSLRPNPAWLQRVAAINKYLADQFNRQLQAGYDQIAAAARLSQQISANNDAMIASIEQQRMASNSSASPAGSSAAKFDDYIRGVTTVEDPYYGTSQQSSNSSFHWTDGYGNYRNSNEATYDPNRSEVGNWTTMKAIR